MAFNQQPPPTARPMTAVRGAGYRSETAAGRPGGNAVFDPLNQAKSMPSPFQRPEEKSPEARIKVNHQPLHLSW